MLRGGCRVRAAVCVDQEGERGEPRVSGRRVDSGDIGAQAFICSLFSACDRVDLQPLRPAVGPRRSSASYSVSYSYVPCGAILSIECFTLLLRYG